jgi:PAS domain S-box-containing protein
MTDLRLKLLTPLGAFALILAAYALAQGAFVLPPPAALLLLLATALAVLFGNIEVLVLRPLGVVQRAAQDLARRAADGAAVRSAGSMRDVAADLARLGERMREYDARLAEEKSHRQALEENLRELQERYTLTVERANDGIWECDLRSGTVQCSSRWKAMLGHGDASVVRQDDWQALLHPDERAAVLLRLGNHLNGLTPRFEEEYRLRHGDGHYRWIRSRGAAIRHATGKAYRLVVMDNDIHARKVIEQTLIHAAEALSSVSGDAFYRALLQTLSMILGTRDNLVCYCVGDPPTHARTLAYYSKGRFWKENFEYELAGTSCGAVIERREIVYAPTGVCDLWPAEREYDRDSYIGVPMFDSTGKIIGHFACMDGKPMRQDLPHLALFRIFSVRAAAELERTLLREKLEASRVAGVGDHLPGSGNEP